MTPGPTSESATVDAPSTDLCERLAADMAARWQQGQRPRVEEFLASHPSLADQADAVVRLVCEEVCLRREYGEAGVPSDILERFPRWRSQLEVLLDCDRVLAGELTGPRFPEVGEMLGDCRVLAELGRGARGRVFLAAQPTLADRLVVLKLTPCGGQEHLSLARLQHTHIVPIYSVQEDPERNLLALCMPWFGGVTLYQILRELRETPIARRSGRSVLDALDRSPHATPRLMPRGPARRFLASATWTQAICWIGANLADALHYAHERGLVHLDVKPSNVLITADGTPMLLDFHLAREPFDPQAPASSSATTWLGGTPAYASPEQKAGLAALQAGKPAPAAIDARSDICSLGFLLAEALGMSRPAGTRRVASCPSTVSAGLADILGRCLASDPNARYPDAASLAADLRRHLGNLPLQGVANRSFAERWRKWRRRRPYTLPLLALLLGALAVGLVALLHFGEDWLRAEAALRESSSLLQTGRDGEALVAVRHGLQLAADIPFGTDLRRRLAEQKAAVEQRRHVTERAQAAANLQAVTDGLRLLLETEQSPTDAMRRLEAQCRTTWEQREQIARWFQVGPAGDWEPRVRSDLLELAILWTELRVRLAPPGDVAEAHREGLRILEQAEARFGASAALYRERQVHAKALSLADEAAEAARRSAALPPATAWEHYALGRSFLRAGDLERADVHLNEAIELQPEQFWFWFAHGICAYRLGRSAEASAAFGVCVALAPPSARARCYFNRALAEAARDRIEQAQRDYTRALELEPGMAAAWFNRGMLYLQVGKHESALADLRQALERGAAPALVHYDLALVHMARGDRKAALESIQEALKHAPDHAEARALQARLREDRSLPHLSPSEKNRRK